MNCRFTFQQDNDLKHTAGPVFWGLVALEWSRQSPVSPTEKYDLKTTAHNQNTYSTSGALWL